MLDVEFRIQRAVESILENERLTDGLDDETAQVLLNWGVSLATAIVTESGDLSDVDADQRMKPRLKATRRLLRYVNTWLAKRTEWDQTEERKRLVKICKVAKVAYGFHLEDEFEPPEARLETLIAESGDLTGTPAELVVGFRLIIERLVI